MLEQAVVRGLAAAAVALFVARSPLMLPVRERTFGLINEGVTCPYCCAGWLSLALCAAYPAGPVLLVWLASWGVAGLVAAGIDYLIDPD